ncbi:ABC transporter ATP-binding protein [Chlorobium sp. N1]|uniref:ABC transporter ATP-binding protein n=1 Tax=Chlorobium sp. N1 TaxID=2491138 RepID=UPI00103C6229|nr:ABC transporter ATP-binding protein [Chlorobium sp. N1]TCD47211.1 ABC transporter ATP-binding protein [Chlorobium sp. N1]
MAVTGGEAVLEVRGADMGYGGKAVLRNVSFSLNQGEILSLLGPNGVGKTTLFKSVMGFIPLLSGSLILGGRDIGRLKPRDIARIAAYVPQSHGTPFPYKVEDVVLFGRTAHLGPLSSPSRQDRMIAAGCLERLGAGHLSGRTFTELSGGERQMVIIARALAQEARFIILDEPTSSLDYGNQVRIIRKLRELRLHSVAVLMSTHHPDHAFMLGSKVLVMKENRQLRCGSPDSVLTGETLHSLYGVEVDVVSFSSGGGPERKVCAPIL